ncbi:ATP-binding protein [Rhizobium pusense]|uniref:NB-ARC domain-containing protein n=1 Tax=Agrobacterium pusense TaxID=648995 RepID=UPI001C6DFBEA|nr:NB-ARC domain-containing protein [Agrobacterium pusense]MBW9076395.1 ATP-binding protein [Agrobacterium pusense]
MKDPEGILNDELYRRFVRDLLEDLQGVSGASLEKLLKPIWDKMAGAAVQTNGLNLQGAPISGALDALWPDGSASEASSDKDFFNSKEAKLRHDIRHLRQAAPHICHWRIFSTRYAGPTARTRQSKRRARYLARGVTIDVHAGQDIAEYVVKECLLDDRLVARIAPILPNLRRISEQYAASQRVPDLDKAFRGRKGEIDAVKGKLSNNRCVVISGMGGIGKTELACAVAHAVRSQYEQVIWIDAAALKDPMELGAFDVRSNGYKLNVLGIVQTQSALVILDNVAVDLDLDTLTAKCGPASSILLTSQVAWGSDPLRVEELSKTDAEEVLSAGVPTPCPSTVLNEVLDAVGGHPLLLRILNGLVKDEQVAWEELAEECAHLPAAIDERRQTVAQRIVRRNLAVLGSRLAPFLWASSAILDSVLAKRLMGRSGIVDLERWAFLARSQRGTERLHDIVYACAEALRAEIPIADQDLNAKLEKLLRANIDPKTVDFVRVARRHGTLLARLLAERPVGGILRYAYLHSAAPRDLNPELIGDPTSHAEGSVEGPEREWVLSIVETVECSYRSTRDRGDKETAKQKLEGRLPVFDHLEQQVGSSSPSITTIRHHRAKSLLKLGRVKQAKEGFEALVTTDPFAYPSMLQLARLLQDDPERAKTLLFAIIEAELSQPGSVQITTLIESLATMRRRHLHQFNREMTDRYGSFMAQMIKAAAWSGEAQPVRAFAAVGPDWSYRRPELFLEVFQEIDLGEPASAEDDDERVAVGRICIAAAKMLTRSDKTGEAEAEIKRALSFFAALRRVSPFASVHYADAALMAGDAERAGQILDAIPEHQRDPFWHLRRTEATRTAGEPGALELVDKGLVLLEQLKYRATFLAAKADILRPTDQDLAATLLQEAIDCCEEEKFRLELTTRLSDWGAV